MKADGRVLLEVEADLFVQGDDRWHDYMWAVSGRTDDPLPVDGARTRVIVTVREAEDAQAA